MKIATSTLNIGWELEIVSGSKCKVKINREQRRKTKRLKERK